MAEFAHTDSTRTLIDQVKRILLESMTNQDKRDGLGGYYITKADVERLHRLLGSAAEPALRAAGFEPDPRPRRKGWWTGSRAPGGDGAKIRFRLEWSQFPKVGSGI